MKKVLVTGGAGFVGTHLIEHILKNTDWHVVSLDRYDTSGNPNRLAEMIRDTFEEEVPLKTVFWDLKSELNDQVRKQLGGPFDYIIHVAAGSHVDRSIEDPLLFFMDNCVGTVNLLNYARQSGLKQRGHMGDEGAVLDGYDGRFLYFSTDEVYGPAPETITVPTEPFLSEVVHTATRTVLFEGFKEWARLNPNNPYAAAKAAAEMAVISFANTYRMPCVITNTMNIFGERQNPEKFIPLIINKVLSGEKLLIHADKTKTKAGKRHYIHARNISAATLWVLEHGKVLDGSAMQGRYNVVGEVEMDNLALAQLVHKFVAEYEATERNGGARGIGPLNYELVDFHSSRPGHDLRYALDGSLIKSEGFEIPVSFEESLRRMVYWTLEHRNKWL